MPNRLPYHMRIAALQCNFEGGVEQTLQVPGLWQEFGFSVEQLFHTHSELYSAIFEQDRHGELLAKYTAECQSRGIEIILYMNCHILLESQRDMALEWAQVSRDGEYVKSYGTYHACCLNSSWLDYFLASIESLKGFDISGFFFDGPSASQCFCPRCDELFGDKYGKPMVESESREIAEFTLRSKIDFVRKTHEKTKEVNPDWVSYINANLMHAGASCEEMRELLSYNDIIGTEGGFQFYGPPKGCDIWRCGIHAKFVDAVAGDKRRVIFMAGDHKPWSWYLHTPAETKLCYASTLANGASVWYGIHCSTDNLRGGTGEAAREMVQFDKKHEKLYAKTESAADIALFYSYDTGKHYTASGEVTDFYGADGQEAAQGIGNYSESFQGAYGLLFRAGLAFDVVTDLDLTMLSRYSALVIPTGACLSDGTAESIREFVRNGGTVIADSETSLYTETFTKRDDFQLADVLGIDFNGTYRRYGTHDYFAMEPSADVFRDDGVKRLPAPLVALDVSPRDGAEVMARLFPPIPGRYAGRPEKPGYVFMVKNQFGKGCAYYLAGTFFELYRGYGITHYKKLIKSILAQHHAPAVELLDAPESVEFTVRTSQPSGALLIHLVNYTGGMSRPIDRVVPVSGMSLRINRPFATARALVADRELDAQQDGLVPLPEVGEFEVVVIA